jgi:hypothetical protein
MVFSWNRVARAAGLFCGLLALAAIIQPDSVEAVIAIGALALVLSPAILLFWYASDAPTPSTDSRRRPFAIAGGLFWIWALGASSALYLFRRSADGPNSPVASSPGRPTRIALLLPKPTSRCEIEARSLVSALRSGELALPIPDRYWWRQELIHSESPKFLHLEVLVRHYAGPQASFFLHDEGFYAVGPLECINAKTGRTISRDSTRLPSIQSLSEYAIALIAGRSGLFRLPLFYVSESPPTYRPEGLAVEIARDWHIGGLPGLPSAIAELPLTDKTAAYLLVYEFERHDTQHEAQRVEAPGRLNPLVHWSSIKARDHL